MRICTIFEQVHILNNTWICQFWYGFVVLIGLIISVVYYVNHKKKAFKQSLLLLLTLCLFSFGMHTLEQPNIDNNLHMDGINGIEEDHFGTSPDYLGKAAERVYDFIRRKFL